MSPRPEDDQHVRRVVLPGGKAIEVVYLHGRGARAPLPAPDDLHVCPACGSALVYPVCWEEAGAQHWQVTLRCPNCERWMAGVFSQRSVEALDDELDRGTEALVRDLRRLARANMEEQIDRFVDALRDDHILPDDF